MLISSSPPNMSETLVLTWLYSFPQVKSLCKSAFYQMRNIARIRRYLSPKTTELLIHAFVSSKLDFCNSLLYGILKRVLRKLQSVQNPTARLVTSSSKVDHVTPLLMRLHWLPIAERIKFNCSFNLQRPPRPIAFLHQRTPYFVMYCTHASIIIYLTFSPDWL